MTVEPAGHHSLLARRSLLFSPDPRLGWTFRDRQSFYTPFTEPEPQPGTVPSYLGQQAAQAENVYRQRLSRTLPLSISAFFVLAVFAGCAASDYSLGKTPVPVASLLFALVALVPGVGLTLLARQQRDRARDARDLAERQARQSYEDAWRSWNDRKTSHERGENARIGELPEWGAVPRPVPRRRLDVYGGTLWSWEALLTTYGTSALAQQPLLVLDLSREVICQELALLSESAGMFVDAQMLPAQMAESTLLSGLPAEDLVDALVESMHGGTAEAGRAERAMADGVLTLITGALGDEITLERIVASLRALMGEPDDSSALTDAERRRITTGLFSVEYRRQAHASMRAIESYIRPLRTLGSRPADRDPGFLTCLALDSKARNVRSELLTDLMVQWVTHRVTATDRPAPGVIVAGADELARRHLERLSDACERRGVPLTLLFRRLRETSLEMMGGGATAFMRLGNHEDAARAADFIGRDYRFVLSQITKNVGGNESHTTSDTHGEGDSDSVSQSHSAGTSENWGTTRSSGTTHAGGHGPWADRSANRGTSRTRGGGTSETDTRGTSQTTSRNWSAAYSYAEGTNWSDADTTQRVYEYAVEPLALQHLPDHALLLVESDGSGGRRLRPVECDPAISTLERVATGPLPDPPPPQPTALPAQAQPAMPYPPQWAAPPAVEPPREPLPYAPGAIPGQQTGPRPEAVPQRHPDPGQDRPGPPPLFRRPGGQG